MVWEDFVTRLLEDHVKAVFVIFPIICCLYIIPMMFMKCSTRWIHTCRGLVGYRMFLLHTVCTTMLATSNFLFDRWYIEDIFHGVQVSTIFVAQCTAYEAGGHKRAKSFQKKSILFVTSLQSVLLCGITLLGNGGKIAVTVFESLAVLHAIPYAIGKYRARPCVEGSSDYFGWFYYVRNIAALPAVIGFTDFTLSFIGFYLHEVDDSARCFAHHVIILVHLVYVHSNCGELLATVVQKRPVLV